MSKINKEISKVLFIFENCESIEIPYSHFKELQLNTPNDIRFRIEGYNFYGADRLAKYDDITKIEIYNSFGEVINSISPEWEDECGENLFQMQIEIDYKKGIYDISISEKKYLENEIKAVSDSIEYNKKRLGYLNEKLSEIN